MYTIIYMYTIIIISYDNTATFGPHYSTERNGTESVVALFYGTERNTANMVNFHKSNLML